MFQLTAYEWSGKRCADGSWPVVGYSCASNLYPLGTVLEIEGLGRRVVTDRGGMGNNVVDIYMGDVEICRQFGRKFNVDIRVVTPEAEEAEPPVVNSEAEEADPPEDEELRGEDEE